MGLRGPPRTPTEVLRKRGSWLANRNPREPRPKRGRPVCPRWISKRAKRAWKELIPLLDAMGVLALIDRNALIRYVQSWAAWREAHEFLNKHGSSYPLKDKSGKAVGFKAFPQVKMVAELSAQLGRLEGQFGMTPAARSRIECVEEKEKPVSDKERFFQMG